MCLVFGLRLLVLSSSYADPLEERGFGVGIEAEFLAFSSGRRRKEVGGMKADGADEEAWDEVI